MPSDGDIIERELRERRKLQYFEGKAQYAATIKRENSGRGRSIVISQQRPTLGKRFTNYQPAKKALFTIHISPKA